MKDKQQLSFELPPARLVARLLIDQRNAERAEAPQQTMVELRKRTDSEYRDLIMILNAYALTDETATSYRTLINILNEDVNYYEKTVFAGSGSSSSSNGQNGSNGENGTTEPGSGDNGGGTDDEPLPPSGGGDDQGGGGGQPPSGGGETGDDEPLPPSGGGGTPVDDPDGD